MPPSPAPPRRRELPPLPDLPALAAFLLGGEGRALTADSARRLGSGDAVRGEAEAVGFLLRNRLAGEAAASPRLAECGLGSSSRRSLAIERERLAVTARTRSVTLARCGEAFTRVRIQAMLYKGEAVIRLTHGDPSRRPMTDIDVIVQPADRARAAEALRGAGFIEKLPATPLHDVFMDTRNVGHGHPHGVAVEVHDDVFPRPHPFALDLDAVRQRCTPADVDGFLLPHAADALVLGAFHLVLFERDASKGWMGLSDLARLAEMGAAREPELPELVRMRANAWGVGPVVPAAGRRAVAWAGGPAWLSEAAGDFDRARGRRGLALSLVLRELDATLVSEVAPAPRVLPVKLVAALWPESLGATARALGRGLGWGGAPTRLFSRLRRYAASLGRALRA